MLTKFRLLFLCVALVLFGSLAVVAGSAGASNQQLAVRPAAAKPLTRAASHSGGLKVVPAAAARSVSFRKAQLSRAAVQRAASSRTLVPHLDPALNSVAGVAGSAAADFGVRVSKHGTVEVTVTGAGAVAAAHAVGGRVLVSRHGSTVVSLRPSLLPSLAAQPGVSAVTETDRLVADVTSEGVHSADADAWQNAPTGTLGNGGAGVNVGIVDLGFGNLAAEIAAGHFGATDGSLVHYTTGSAQDECADDSASDHGTAVAEIVHQMAPNANLYLYCVDNPDSFSDVADQIVAAGNIKVVSSSLDDVGDSRADGTGEAELAIKTARQAGVLWIQSAGNSAQDHWSGTLRDANRNHILDLPDPYLEPAYRTTNEIDATALEPGGSGDIVLTWDQWPTSKLPIYLGVQEYGSDNKTAIGGPVEFKPKSGAPRVTIHIENTDTEVHFYDLWVSMNASNIPPLRYDLTYDGDFVPSYLANADPGQAAYGSISEPATSPYALAVGAADWRSDGLEPFSGQGPTIDGRVKPDLVGYDGVSSNITDMESSQVDDLGNPVPNTLGFYGTSAGAPHVAGAAALVAAANPDMDASEIEAFLESPGNGVGALNPPVNGSGHGLLNLGTADPSQVHPAAGSAYFPLSNPVRIVDTRSGLGVRRGPMLAGTELAVPVSTSLVPADATSVVVEVSGTAAKGGTYLSVYSTGFGGVATLPLTVQEPNATITSIVTLNAQHGFKLRNQAAQTDALVTVVGYFGAPGGAGGLGYVPLASHRLLDTRIPSGGPKGPLKPNQAVTVDTAPGGVPASASVAVVNITALNHNAGGYLTAYPSSSPAVASVNYAVLSRPNLTLVPLVNGTFVLQNRAATTDAMVDIVGYFDSSATARYVGLPAPVRIADTRSGNAAPHGVLTTGNAFDLDAGGLYQVPYQVSGLWIGMTAIGTVANPLAGAGYLTIYPAGTAWPHASNLDFTGSRSILNNGIATLSARTPSRPPGFNTSDTGASVNVIEDAYGYFVTPDS